MVSWAFSKAPKIHIIMLNYTLDVDFLFSPKTSRLIKFQLQYRTIRIGLKLLHPFALDVILSNSHGGDNTSND